MKYVDSIDLNVSLRGNRAKAAVSFSSLMLRITRARFEACQRLPHRLGVSWLHLAAAARSRSSGDLNPARPQHDRSLTWLREAFEVVSVGMLLLALRQFGFTTLSLGPIVVRCCSCPPQAPVLPSPCRRSAARCARHSTTQQRYGTAVTAQHAR